MVAFRVERRRRPVPASPPEPDEPAPVPPAAVAPAPVGPAPVAPVPVEFEPGPVLVRRRPREAPGDSGPLGWPGAAAPGGRAHDLGPVPGLLPGSPYAPPRRVLACSRAARARAGSARQGSRKPRRSGAAAAGPGGGPGARTVRTFVPVRLSYASWTARNAGS